jgi:hypothetical protein
MGRDPKQSDQDDDTNSFARLLDENAAAEPFDTQAKERFGKLISEAVAKPIKPIKRRGKRPP